MLAMHGHAPHGEIHPVSDTPGLLRKPCLSYRPLLVTGI